MSTDKKTVEESVSINNNVLLCITTLTALDRRNERDSSFYDQIFNSMFDTLEEFHKDSLVKFVNHYLDSKNVEWDDNNNVMIYKDEYFSSILNKTSPIYEYLKEIIKQDLGLIQYTLKGIFKNIIDKKGININIDKGEISFS